MDNKFRIASKLSVIDLAIVLVLTAAIVFGVNILAPKNISASSKETPITYTIELYKTKPDLIQKVEVGTTLYDNLKGYTIGTITNVEEAPYTEDVPDFENNMYKKASIEGFNYVYVTVQANATITDESTKIGDYEVLVGTPVYVRTDKFTAGGFIVSIKK